MREDVKTQLRAYVDLRVKADAVATVEGEWRALGDAGGPDPDRPLRSDARRAAELVPNPVTSGLFIQALNDARSTASVARDAALNRHVPEIVLWLLFAHVPASAD